MNTEKIAVIEFDTDEKALFNPENFVAYRDDCPKIAVTCFAENLINYAVNTFSGKIFSYVHSANGDIPLYEITVNNVRLIIFMSLIGAPASVGQLEEVFAIGVEKILVFGTCGVLDRSIEDCSIIVPNIAVRDEGTSFHYCPASREIDVNVKTLNKMSAFLNNKNISYKVGKVWTTDAVYRETVKKIKTRKEEKCICVDMECSALAALAKFRNKEIAQFFYAADNLDSEIYDERSLSNKSNADIKEKILNIACDMAIDIF